MFQVGNRLVFIGKGNGPNCINAETGHPLDRKVFDFRGKICTIFDDRGRQGTMTVCFDDLPYAVWTMVKDEDDFQLLAEFKNGKISFI